MKHSIPVAEVQKLVIKGYKDVCDERGEGRESPADHLRPFLLYHHFMYPVSI